MTKLWRIAYNGIVVPAAAAGLPLARRMRPGIEAAAAAREGLFERWEAGLEPLVGRTPRIWLHAASAGETLQAQPLAEEIRRAQPAAALLYTHFSPSARRWAAEMPAVDVADYLPFDLPRRMRRFLDLLVPDLLILVGGEMWPNLVWSAAGRGVPVVQACARLVGADRMGWPVRGLTRELYHRLDAVAAVADEDAEVMRRRLGVPGERVRVAGDTRADVTLERARKARAEGPPGILPEGRRPVIVAGSTWPADEAVLLPALAGLAAGWPGLLALVVPHDPTGAAVAGLEARARGLGLRTARWSVGDPNATVTIVDQVGLLYRLYALADLAYVGGGFGGAVHNTMEPAAMGVPVAIGPRHGEPHEVAALEKGGGLQVVSSAPDLHAWWETLLVGDRARESGEAARQTLLRMAGATDRILRFFADRGHLVA
ncbi:MAG TPA: glycosyltransferase N-terminal domain-containing protein [Gemmatimonadota bacterium]|nr:glycosyltransferase N-terminal domain-containing protein [Gemmatimonadota bacterium]